MTCIPHFMKLVINVRLESMSHKNLNDNDNNFTPVSFPKYFFKLSMIDKTSIYTHIFLTKF